MLLACRETPPTRPEPSPATPPQTAAVRAAPPPEDPAPTAELRPLTLVVGTVAEAELRGGETHAYAFGLMPGWFADLTVDQRGIDVEARLSGPGGEAPIRIDSPNGTRGPEPLPLVAAGAGDFRLEVRSLWSGDPPGRYALRVDALRPATADDRRRVDAERTFAAGETLRRQGDGASLRSALGELREAAEAFGRLGEPARQGDALYALGVVHDLLGNPAGAVEAHGRALPLFRASGKEVETANALNSLGVAYRGLGRPERAEPLYREALAIYRSRGDRTGEAASLNDLGRVHESLGNTDEALRYFERAIVLRRELGERTDEGLALSNLGWLYVRLGRHRQALEILEEAASLLAAKGHERLLAHARLRLGWVHGESGRYEQAIAELRPARDALRAAGDRRGEAEALNNLGWTYRASGDPARARDALSRALAVFEDVGDPRSTASVLANLGALHLAAGETREAAASYRRALPLFAATGDAQGEASALFGMARARHDLGSLEAARSTIERAIDRIETLRVRPRSPGLRTSFFASKQEYYAFYVDLLMDFHRRETEAGHDALALAASERARARSLLDLMAGEAETRPRGRTANLAEIQRELRAGALLLEYALGRNRSYLWAVTEDGLTSHELAPRAVLEAAARRVHRLLAESRKTLVRAQAELALAELGRLLLEPVAGQLDGRRLLVVPDGALHFAPFAALPIPAGRPGPPGLPRLVAEHEVVTLASASTLVELRRGRTGRRPAPEAVAVIADPVFDARDPRVRPGAGPEGGSRSGPGPSAGPFARLPFTGDEADAILELVPGDRLDARGFDADRSVLEHLGRFGILHFATHGVFHSEHPELSGLALSNVDEAGRPRDGFLRVHEIYRLDLPADLVVLSACETALGELVRGEGLVGLTHAFTVAGARRVLVSLWRVDDRATAELMRRFYLEMLVHSREPAAALRRAQIATRERTGWQAPYYWAGFVLHGDG